MSRTNSIFTASAFLLLTGCEIKDKEEVTMNLDNAMPRVAAIQQSFDFSPALLFAYQSSSTSWELALHNIDTYIVNSNNGTMSLDEAPVGATANPSSKSQYLVATAEMINFITFKADTTSDDTSYYFMGIQDTIDLTRHNVDGFQQICDIDAYESLDATMLMVLVQTDDGLSVVRMGEVDGWAVINSRLISTSTDCGAISVDPEYEEVFVADYADGTIYELNYSLSSSKTYMDTGLDSLVDIEASRGVLGMVYTISSTFYGYTYTYDVLELTSMGTSYDKLYSSGVALSSEKHLSVGGSSNRAFMVERDADLRYLEVEN